MKRKHDTQQRHWLRVVLMVPDTQENRTRLPAVIEGVKAAAGRMTGRMIIKTETTYLVHLTETNAQ